MRKWIWPVLGAIGVVLFIILSPVANPEAQVDLNVTRQQSLDLSRTFLVGQGFDLTGYESSVSFSSDDDAVVYLQRTQSLEESNRLARQYKVWQWSVRWFKPGEQVEYRVDIDTAEPKVLGFDRAEFPETAAGAHLTQAEARKLAEQFLTQQGYKVSDWTLVGSSDKEQKARVDHHFSWQRKDVTVGQAHPKVDVDIEGDKPAGLHAYLLVPEQFTRDMSRLSSMGTGLTILSFIFILAMWAAALILAIRLAQHGQAAWRLGMWAAALLAGLSIISVLNEFGKLRGSLPTEIPPSITYVVAVAVALFGGVFSGAQILFPAAAGQGLLQGMDRDGAPYFSRFGKGGFLTPGFAASAFRGLCLAGVMLGYDTLFYYIGRKYLGVWSPAGPRYSDILATPMPWLYPLTISIMAGFSEEYTFRLFGIAVAKRIKWLRWTPMALFVPAVIWAFAHSNYPVFPVWTRGIELTIVGLLLGWVFWKYDIETTVVAHYTYDAFLVGWPLLWSGNIYYIVSGAVVTLLALVPAVLGLVARGRAVPATEGVAPVDVPAADAPSAVAARDVGGFWLEGLLAKLRTRTALAVLAAVGVVGLAGSLLLAPGIRPSFAGEYKVSEAQAEQIARDYLKAQGFDLSGLRVARGMQIQEFLPYVRDVVPDDADALARDFAGVRWAIRFYKPLEPVSYRVDVDIRTGAVAGFNRQLPREAKGARLDPAGAQAIAESFLRQLGQNPALLTLTTSSAGSRDDRTDHHFVWENPDPRVPDTKIRREVVIQGDQVGVYRSPYVYVPEAWQRAQVSRTGWLLLLVVGAGLAALGALVMAVIYLVRGQAAWKRAGAVALLGAGLSLPTLLAKLPTLGLSYDTESVWAGFLATQALSFIFYPLVVGAALAALWAVACVVSRGRPEPLPLAQAALAGLALAGAGLGISSLVGFLHARWHTPQTVMPDASGGYLALLGLLNLVLMALAAEYLFRVWLQPLLSRWLRSRLLGLLAQAAVVGAVAALSHQPGRFEPLPGVAAFLGDGLLYGLGYLAGGLPLVVTARVAAGLWNSAAPLLGAGIGAVAVRGYAALALAVAGPLLVWVAGRRREQSRGQEEA